MLDDVSLILYMMPFIASTAYAFLSALPTGVPLPLTGSIYLTVTKSLEVFLIGFSGVVAGLLVEIFAVPKAERSQGLVSGSSRLQRLAVACFALAVISAWSIHGIVPNISSMLSIFLEGRYALVFPLLILALSFLILPSIGLGKLLRASLIDEGPVVLALIAPIIMLVLWLASAPLPQAFAASMAIIIISTIIIINRKQ